MTDEKPLKDGKALARMPEQATARNDVTILGWGDVLRPQDDVLAQRSVGKGLKLYDELARDPRVAAVIDKRKRAVTAREWKVEPGGEKRQDRRAAELTERVLAGEFGLGFDRLCLDLLDAQLKGFAVVELIWAARDGFVVPVEARARDQRRFVFDRDWSLRLLTPEARLDGVPVLPRKFVVHRFGSALDPYGLGLGHRLFWPVFFKRHSIQFWALYCEKFGSPVVRGVYGPGQDPDELLRNLSRLAQDSAVVVPEGTEVELMESARSAGVETYGGFAKYLDEQISEAVLGETLTTNIGAVGSHAAAETHQDVREELADSDADELSATLNATLLAWIRDANFPGAAAAGVWRPRPENRAAEAETRRAEAEAGQAEAAMLSARRSAGFAPEDPEGDLDEQLRGRWVRDPNPPPARPAFSAPSFAAPAERDPADELADQVEEAARPSLDAMIDAVKAELDLAIAARETPEQFQARLARLGATMPLDGLIERLRDGMALAAATGTGDHEDDRRR